MSSKTHANKQLHHNPSLGVILMMLGLALYPLSDALIKHLMESYSFYQTTFLRSTARVIPLFISVFFQGGIYHTLATTHVKKHLIRLAVSLVYTLSFLFALSKSSLTTIYTLSYTSSLFMILLSGLLLKEKISKDRWIAVIAGMLGVVIAIRPTADIFEGAALIVLFGTFLGALQKILIRDLAKTEHSLSIAIYPNLVMLVVSIPFLFQNWISMPLSHWVLFACAGALTAASQYCMAEALRFAPASTLAPVDYSTYFWVIALDGIWWKKIPDLWMVIGAVIIVISNCYVLYRSKMSAKAATS